MNCYRCRCVQCRILKVSISFNLLSKFKKYLLFKHFRRFPWYEGVFEEVGERGPLPEAALERHLVLLQSRKALPPSGSLFKETFQI
jgi:hypothetical protein